MPIASTIATTALVIVLYFGVVRLIDMNEKEPLWAMGMLFALGGAAGLILPWIVSPGTLDLTVLPGASLREVARFGAIAIGIGVLFLLGQWRGWQEFNGTMDGIVYGACAGLGFAVAAELRSEVLFGSVPLPGHPPGLLSGFGTIALRGLSDAVFGAIIGAGIGAASEARAPAARASLPLAGLVGAVAADAAYVHLAHGNSLAGSSGMLRHQIALSLPLLAIAVIAFTALRSERRAIDEQLPSEAAEGAVTPEDLTLLQSVVKRNALHLRELMRGHLRRWYGLRELHNRQVQLALVKAKAAGESELSRRSRLELEVVQVRQDVMARRRALSGDEEAVQ